MPVSLALRDPSGRGRRAKTTALGKKGAVLSSAAQQTRRNTTRETRPTYKGARGAPAWHFTLASTRSPGCSRSLLPSRNAAPLCWSLMPSAAALADAQAACSATHHDAHALAGVLCGWLCHKRAQAAVFKLPRRFSRAAQSTGTRWPSRPVCPLWPPACGVQQMAGLGLCSTDTSPLC